MLHEKVHQLVNVFGDDNAQGILARGVAQEKTSWNDVQLLEIESIDEGAHKDTETAHMRYTDENHGYVVEETKVNQN